MTRLALCLLLALLLSACTVTVHPTPPPNRCHKAIAYAIYQSAACVIYEI